MHSTRNNWVSIAATAATGVLLCLCPACSQDSQTEPVANSGTDSAPEVAAEAGGDVAVDEPASGDADVAAETSIDEDAAQDAADSQADTVEEQAALWKIPPERLIQWDPGYRGPIPDVPVELDAKDQGAAGDGITDDAPAIQAAINAIHPPGALLIPEGTYLFKTPLDLRSGVVLRGEGKDKTHLKFDTPNSSYHGAISAAGWADVEIPIVAGATVGSTVLTTQSATALKVGDSIHVLQDNDPNLMYTDPAWNVDWAANSMGQIVKLTQVSGTKLTIDTPPHIEYKTALHPRLSLLHPVENFGIEKLHVVRLDQAQDSTIRILAAINGWVRDCNVEWGMEANIEAVVSRHITLIGNDVHEQFNYNYSPGIGLSHSSDCLIENNLIYNVRKSVAMALGSSGNVSAYNFSRDLQSESGMAKLDSVTNGHYAHLNLFEGNVGDSVYVSMYWGPTRCRPFTEIDSHRSSRPRTTLTDSM